MSMNERDENPVWSVFIEENVCNVAWLRRTFVVWSCDSVFCIVARRIKHSQDYKQNSSCKSTHPRSISGKASETICHCDLKPIERKWLNKCQGAVKLASFVWIAWELVIWGLINLSHQTYRAKGKVSGTNIKVGAVVCQHIYESSTRESSDS